MKKITVILGFVLLSFGLMAQPIGKGEKQINFGVGFIDGIPLHINMEFGVHPDISLGPEIDFDLGGFDWMRIKVRGDYHWNSLIGLSGPWDVYSGITMGPKIRFNSNNNDNNDGVGFLFQVNLGGRWYWSDWGVNSEFGLGTDINWRFGLSKKL